MTRPEATTLNAAEQVVHARLLAGCSERALTVVPTKSTGGRRSAMAPIIAGVVLAVVVCLIAVLIVLLKSGAAAKRPHAAAVTEVRSWPTVTVASRY